MISIVICTRDRPADLARCLPTVLATTYPDVEVLVVDQSGESATAEVVRAASESQSGPSRLRYHHSSTAGLSRARNEGIQHTRGEIVAFTDDDCTVPADWLQHVERALSNEPAAGIVFGTLAAGPHDQTREFVPTFKPPSYRRIERRLVRPHLIGVGANMSIRRCVFERLGGFDPQLGAGGRFASGEDIEFAYRALHAGVAVIQDPSNVVLHWGARDFGSGAARRLVTGSAYGIGAAHGRLVRHGDRAAAGLFLRELGQISAEVLAAAAQGRRPIGLRRLLNYVRGAAEALAAPSDSA